MSLFNFHSSFQKVGVSFLATLAFSICILRAQAATAFWTGDGDARTWRDAANWRWEGEASSAWPGADAADDVAAFSNLTSAISLTLDAPLNLARLVSYGNATVSISGSGSITLAGGASDATAAIRNTPTVNYASGFDFSVPVTFARADVDGGVAWLYGGMTFRRPVYLPASTQTLHVVRTRVPSFQFFTTSCTADLSSASSIVLGKPGKPYSGTLLSVQSGAQVTVPHLTVPMGATVSMGSSLSSLAVVDPAHPGAYGDVAMPDAMYWNGATPIYPTFTLANGTFICRRFTQGANDGAKLVVSGGSFTATEEIHLASTNGAALVASGGTFKTPRLAVRAGATATFAGNVAFDLSPFAADGVPLTTRVDAVTCTAKATVRATGAGGAISFPSGGTIPVLALDAGVTLLFDGVRTNAAPLVLGRLDLPSAGRARVKVTNRMLTGDVVLARGVTAAQLAALDVDVPACGRLAVDADGALVFSIPTADLTRAASAQWCDGGASGDLDDPANWACRALDGSVLAGVLPDSAAAVVVSGDASLSIPAGGMRDWDSFAVRGAVRLTADCDWRGVDLAAIAAGTRIDLNGHALHLAAGDAAAPAAISIVDSSTGAPGELHVHVPEGETFVDGNLAVEGNVRLVKEDGGDWIVRIARAAPAGGEEIRAGRLVHAAASICYEDFGAVGDGVADDQSAIVDAHACANLLGLPVKAKSGATYRIGGAANVAEIRTDVDFGAARFIFDDPCVALADKNSPVFRIASDLDDFTVAGLDALPRGATALGIRLGRDCLVRLVDSTAKIFIREGANANNGSDRQEVVLANAEGVLAASTPLTWTYTNLTSVVARPIDARTLVVTGGTFVTVANRASVNDNYFHRGFDVRRSNVELLGLRHEVAEEGDDGAAYSGFFVFSNVAHVRVRDCVFSGHRRYKQTSGVYLGTYDIGINSSIDVSFARCSMVEGHLLDGTRWGVIGSNFCRDLLLEDCSFSRFDAHQGVYNATLRNTVLGVNGLNAIGFGTLLLENVTVKAAAFITLRSDYGAFWDGDFILRDCTFEPNVNARRTGVVLSGSWNDAHDFGYPCPMPSRIVFDGFHVVDTNVPAGYAGPWLFSNFNSKWTTPDYVEPVAHAQVQRVVFNRVTTASGKPLQICPNANLFTETEFVTNAPPTDVRFSVREPEVGWNRTNALVRVDVAGVDVSDGADYALTFSVFDAAGALVSEETRAVSAAGEQTFSVDLASAAAGWSYAVRARRNGYAAALASPPVVAGAWNGAWQPGLWFAADVVDGVACTTNATWAQPPEVDAEANGFWFEDGGVLRPCAGAPASNEHVRVEASLFVENLTPPTRFADLDAAMALAACTENGNAHWRALSRDAAGAPAWIPLVGDEPATGVCRTVRFEIDAAAAVARCFVSAPDGDGFLPLARTDGVVWLPLAKDDVQAVSEIGIAGSGFASAFAAAMGDVALAEVDGRRFDDLNAALAAAGQSGGTVTLLADVLFTPDAAVAADGGALDAAGKQLKWRDADGAAFAWNPDTGRFRLLPGGAANGLDSYVSYALGLDASDPEAQVRVSIVPVEGTGEWRLETNVDPPAGSGAKVSFQLEEADTPDFARSTLSPAQSGAAFTTSPAAGANARFYRVHVTVE